MSAAERAGLVARLAELKMRLAATQGWPERAYYLSRRIARLERVLS